MATPPNASASFDMCLKQLARSGWEAAAANFLALWQQHPLDLKFGLMAGAGLIHTGQEDAGAALLSFLADRGHIIRTAQFNPAVETPLREASALADVTIRKTFTRLQVQAIDACTDAGRIRSAIWPQTHDGPPPFPKSTTPPDRTRPRPYVFYAPDLPPIDVFETASWTEKLGAQADIIRSEFLAMMTKDSGRGAPYVPAESPFGADWSRLKGQTHWKAVHLYKDYQRQPAAVDCPLTCAALNDVPITRQNGMPIEAFFSVLAPQTTIPPHYGLANARVTVHLPLIVPSSDAKICGIRVGQNTHSWTPARPFIFDDSFDHSAWNLSEDSRVVLIFEAWRPDMTQGEINAVKASYEAREAYTKHRGDVLKTLAQAAS